MARADWSAALSFLFLTAFPSTLASWSSSERSPSPELDDELIRDAPLYPPLQGLESLDNNPGTYETQENVEHTSNYQELINSNLENENLIENYEVKAKIDATIENKEFFDINVDVREIINETKPENEENPIEATWENQNVEENIEKVETEEETNVQTVLDVSEDDGEIEERVRKKRDSEQDWNKTKTNTPRIKTGDTILNIRGAVRDAISDGPRPPTPRLGRPAPATRLDAVVIRPAAATLRPPLEQVNGDAKTTQTPRDGKELLVEAHARATINCDLTNVTGLKWFKDGEAINLPWGSHSGEPVWREKAPRGGELLIVARATRVDAASWRCTGIDERSVVLSGSPVELVIYEPVRAVYLSVDGRRLDAGNTWVPALDAAALPVQCHAEGGVPAPSLSWRLVALDPVMDTRPYVRTQQTNYSIDGVSTSLVVVRAARELHNSSLICTAEQRNPNGGVDDTSAKLEIRVTYPPSFVISRYPGFGIGLTAGAAAALRCDVDANPGARAWWVRDNAPLPAAPAPTAPYTHSATLRFPLLSPTHAGWYRCRATWMHQHYSSIGYYLNVNAADESEPAPPTPPSPEEDESLDHQKVDVPLGGNVQLNCPKGSVGCWWRKSDNGTTGWSPTGSHYAHGVLGIKEALYQEGGEYRCIGAKAPDVTRLRELKRVTLRVTGAATAAPISVTPTPGGWRLECLACGREVRVTWLRGGRTEQGALAADNVKHCWRATLVTSYVDEIWCVAVGPSGGAVAVFPPRPASPRTPAPARHAVRQEHDASVSVTPLTAVVFTAAMLVLCR